MTGLLAPDRSHHDVGGLLHAPPRPAPPVALYVHVPFCVSVCPYCDFVVVRGGGRGPRGRMLQFVAALRTELELRADALDASWGPPARPTSRRGPSARPPLDSVYLGGGTPSLLPADAVSELLGLVRERFGLAPDAEVTLEADPAPGERGDPVGFVAAGVTRVSLGAQSLDDGELRRLGRRHQSADVAEAVDAYRSAGIASLGLDLLYDVPGQSAERWEATLDAGLCLGPDHLSLYALTLDDPDAEGLTGPVGSHLPVPPGARRWRERARREQDEDRAAAMYLRATERLAASRFRDYEISNWARPGHESRHDLAYWTREPYEAVGPGAHAFDGVARRWNAARLAGYLAALAPGEGAGGMRPTLPPGGAETIDIATTIAERVILGLRLDGGVPVAWADEPPLREVEPWARAHGLAEVAGDRLRLTSRGRLLSNEVFLRLI